MRINTETRALIAREIDVMAKQVGINEPCNINTLVRRALFIIEKGVSADKALFETELLARKIVS
jgi:hypothetical protein